MSHELAELAGMLGISEGSIIHICCAPQSRSCLNLVYVASSVRKRDQMGISVRKGDQKNAMNREGQQSDPEGITLMGLKTNICKHFHDISLKNG
jgi:hypothetical protein